MPSSFFFTEWCERAVKLHEYARIIGYPECAFFGVNRYEEVQAGCRVLWQSRDRDMVARYLCEAQEEIELEIGYPLSPTYFVEEQHDCGNPVVLDWAKIIASGIRAESDISLDEPVDHTSDPAHIGPIATALTDTSEIHVFYPGTDQEIFPQLIEIAGGNLDIWIPRCRMVGDWLLGAMPEDGVDYNDTTQFQDTVDVLRIYTDTSDQGELVKPHRCSSSCSSSWCSEHTAALCVYLEKPKFGIVSVGMTGTSICCDFTRARINYLAGLTQLTKQLQDTVVRLAHSKMPKEPCGCEPVRQVWERDNDVPDYVLAQRGRAYCPFGMSNGAWTAWMWTQQNKIYKMHALTG